MYVYVYVCLSYYTFVTDEQAVQAQHDGGLGVRYYC